jgi:hypothetical protein
MGVVDILCAHCIAHMQYKTGSMVHLKVLFRTIQYFEMSRSLVYLYYSTCLFPSQAGATFPVSVRYYYTHCKWPHHDSSETVRD